MSNYKHQGNKCDEHDRHHHCGGHRDSHGGHRRHPSSPNFSFVVATANAIGGQRVDTPMFISNNSEIDFVAGPNLAVTTQKVGNTAYVQYSSGTPTAFAMSIESFDHDLSITQVNPGGWVTDYSSSDVTTNATGSVTLPAGVYQIYCGAAFAVDADTIVSPSANGTLNAGLEVVDNTTVTTVVSVDYPYSNLGGNIPSTFTGSNSQIIALPESRTLTFSLRSDATSAATLSLGIGYAPSAPALKVGAFRIGTHVLPPI